MPVYEYKVVPAPEKGLKGKGVKGPRERFANALQTIMNQLGADGWDYVRADTLPCEERSGLTGSTTSYQNMLVFRREKEAEAPAVAALPAPVAVPEPAPVVETGTEAEPTEAPDLPFSRQLDEPEKTKDAAAAAAAAALTAYRDTTSGAPKLGPAPERHPERDS